MSLFRKLTNEWLLSWQQTGPGPDRVRRGDLPGKKGPRSRPRKQLMVEPVEERVLMSMADLGSIAASASAEVLRSRKAPVLIGGVSGSGVQGGSATLVASMSSDGAPLVGRIVRFQIKGRGVGKATTDDQGVATLTGANLQKLKAGTFSRGITATFAGDSSFKSSTGRGALLVSTFPTSLTGVSASGAFGGTGRLTAILTSNGNPISGQPVSFVLDGKSVGVATTDGRGIATLGNVTLPAVNAGVYARAVTASFAGGITYQPRSTSGALTVTQAQATFSLGGLSQTYDGTGKAVTVTTNPKGLAYTLTYTDADGKPVTSPRTAGSYNVNATINDPSSSYTGSVNAVLVIAPAQVNLGGVTASNKVYDGSTSAKLNTTRAALLGVIPGDSVTLSSSNATGTFGTKNVGTGKTVTASGFTLLGPDAANYQLVQPTTTTANVTTATLTVTGITADNKGFDGSTAATLDTSKAALVGVFGNDKVTLVTTNATGTFDTPAIGTGKTVTVSGLTLSGADAANYTLVEPTTKANITVGTLTVSGITAHNKVYDETTLATIDDANAALVGVSPGDQVTLSTVAAKGTFSSRGAGEGKTVTISGLTIGGADAAKYSLAPTTTTANITAAPLTASGITASNKVYNGGTVATLNTASAELIGVLAGDDATLVVGNATGAFASKGVGTGKTVTVSGLSLAGAEAANYALTPTTTTANITAATLTVTGITAANKGYDGTTAATLDTAEATLAGEVTGDNVALVTTNATGTFDTPAIGTGKTVTVSGLTLSGTDAANYTLVQPTTTANITVGTLTVSGITASDKVYDGTAAATLDDASATLVGIAPGDQVTLNTGAATGAFSSRGVGAGKTVTVSGLTLSGADAAKYTLAPTTTTANITAAPLTASGITASNKLYNGSTVATLDTGSAELIGVLAGDDATLVVGNATGAFASKGVGTGKTVTVSGLSLAGTDAANYALSPTTTTADITAATLTVTGVTAANKGYDGTTAATLDTAGAALAGVVAGDNVALVTGAATGTFDTPAIGTGKTVTVSGLTLSGTDAANYTLVEPTTTANITVGTLTVSGITASDKVYDDSTTATIDATAAELSGIAPGDQVTLNVGAAVGDFSSKGVGASKTVTVSGLTLSGADAGKYVLAPTTTTATITAAPVTVIGITADNKVYNGSTVATLDTGSAVLNGVYAGDEATLVVDDATGAFASKGVGTGKTVTVSGLTLAGAEAANYTLVQPTATADITFAPLTVSGITAEDKAFDGNTSAVLVTTNAALEGVVAGDDVAIDVTTAVGNFVNSSVGTDKTVLISGVIATGADSVNYTLTQPTTTASIT